MAFEDDMIDAGFSNEESYLEHLLEEDDERIERQSQEDKFWESMDDDEYETYMQELAEERRLKQQRIAIETSKRNREELMRKENMDSKINGLRKLKEHWLSGNSTDVLLWNELEKQEEKKFFYDELLSLQIWYSWVLCREEYRAWKVNNIETHERLKRSFDNLLRNGYSTEEEYNEFTFHYIYNNLNLCKDFDFLYNIHNGTLCLENYNLRVEQFELWKTENEKEWQEVIKSPDRDLEDINEIRYISELNQESIIDFFVLNDIRYTFSQVEARYDEEDASKYFGKRDKLTEQEEVQLRKKYFPEYYNEIITHFKKYLRTLNEMSMFAESQSLNYNFLMWLVNHRELDISQRWLDNLQYDSAPLKKGVFRLHFIEDFSFKNINVMSIFMGGCLGINYMHLMDLSSKSDNYKLKKILEDEDEFLKGYNEWLYYMDITGAYENFFERLNQNELLYKSN